jgi:ketosteroid isomerase-like protein
MTGHTVQMVEQLWALLERSDWEAAKQLLHPDFVQEWPQSGERIRGADNSMAVNQNYPGFPKMTPRRTVAGGDVAVTEVVLDYGGQIYHAVSIFEFKDDKIVRETDYFASPFEAPKWREQWVERM